MLRQRPHAHPCMNAPWCTHLVECDGERELNHDGEPPVICREYHIAGGTIRSRLCEVCEAGVVAVPRADAHA